MNTVEQRLRSAAEETRQLANQHWPAPLATNRPAARSGWLAFAAAFAVVAVAFGLIPWLAGNSGQQVGETPPLTTPVDTAATFDDKNASCSSTDTPLPGEAVGLPSEVARTRYAIADAAARCDFDALEALAAEGFTTSFGGGGVENISLWEEKGTGQLGTLLQVLDMSYATVDDGQGGQIYVWPAAYAYESWVDVPPELIDELREIYTQSELDLLGELGSYGGWRTGIDQSGDWLFFVAGD
ncbi:MAG: hypothetical protein ACRDU9_07235 [Acidimicrobiia bacterium]